MSDSIPDGPDSEKFFATQGSQRNHGFVDFKSPCGLASLRYHFVREEVEERKLLSTFSNLSDLLRISLAPFDNAAKEFEEAVTRLRDPIIGQNEGEQENKLRISIETLNQLASVFNGIVERSIQKPDGPVMLTKIDPDHLASIIELIYNRNIEEVKELNNYTPWTPEVYGETTYELVSTIIEQMKISDSDTFLDLGSGVGNVVIQVAARCFCKESFGIEIVDNRAEFAKKMDSDFRSIMGWLGKMYGTYELISGDFLEHKDKFHKANVIFTNNYAFSPELNLKLKIIFADLPEGVRIIVSKSLTDEKFRINEKTYNDPSAVLPVRGTVKGKVSWTDGDVTFFIHEVDRALLNRFMESRQDPKLRAKFEEEQRQGRPNYYESSSEVDSRGAAEKSESESSGDESGTRKRGTTTRNQWSRQIRRKRGRSALDGSDSEEEASFTSSDSETSYSSESQEEKPRSLPSRRSSQEKQPKRRRGRPPKSVSVAAPSASASGTESGRSALNTLHKQTVKQIRAVDRSAQRGSTLVGAEAQKNPKDDDQVSLIVKTFMRTVEESFRKMLLSCKDANFSNWTEQRMMMDLIHQDLLKKREEELLKEVSLLRGQAQDMLGNIFKSVGVTTPKTVEEFQKTTRENIKTNQLLKSRHDALKDHLIWLKETNDKNEEWAKKNGLQWKDSNGGSIPSFPNQVLMPPPVVAAKPKQHQSTGRDKQKAQTTPAHMPVGQISTPAVPMDATARGNLISTPSREHPAPPQSLPRSMIERADFPVAPSSKDPANYLSALGQAIETSLSGNPLNFSTNSKGASSRKNDVSSTKAPSSVSSNSGIAHSKAQASQNGPLPSTGTTNTVMVSQSQPQPYTFPPAGGSSMYGSQQNHLAYQWGAQQYASMNGLGMNTMNAMTMQSPFTATGYNTASPFANGAPDAFGYEQVKSKMAQSISGSFSAIPGSGTSRVDSSKAPQQSSRVFEAITPPAGP